MVFRMVEGSLFAVLLRSSWWYSVMIGLVFISVSAVILGGKYLILGIAGALPFFAIAGVSAYKQSQRPSRERVLEIIQQARKMPAAQIARKIAESYVEKRFDAIGFKGAEADLELVRGNRTYLLSCKRFKAANTGIGPLKQLVAAGEASEATGYLYVALGELSDAAREYASQNDIEIIQAEKLTEFFDGKVEIG